MKILFLLLLLQVSFAKEYKLYVAPKKSNDYAFMKNKVDKKTSFLFNKIHKAINKASEIIKSGSPKIKIMVAKGEYKGKARSGIWMIPHLKNKKAEFYLLGGYSDSFKKRNPFIFNSSLIVADSRSRGVIHFDGIRKEIKKLVISGFKIDGAPANTYDPNSNNISPSRSPSAPLIWIGQTLSDHIEISDNILFNAPLRSINPSMVPLTKKSKVVIKNNIFFNNVMNFSINASNYKKPIPLYLIESNSFILNWPVNPDPTTSEPGAIRVADKKTANLVRFKSNLFYHNIGGAIYSPWDDTKSTPLSINKNLFYKNGTLFNSKSKESGAIVGKFNKSPKHQVFSMEEIEDDFSWSSSGNISEDPKIKVPFQKLIAVKYKKFNKGKSSKDLNKTKALNKKSEITSEIESDSEEEMEELEDFDIVLNNGKTQNFAPQAPLNDVTSLLINNGKLNVYGASIKKISKY